MNWVEGLVCITAIVGLCTIVDAICSTVRYWLGERPRRGGHYPLPPPVRNPAAPPGAE